MTNTFDFARYESGDLSAYLRVLKILLLFLWVKAENFFQNKPQSNCGKLLHNAHVVIGAAIVDFFYRESPPPRNGQTFLLASEVNLSPFHEYSAMRYIIPTNAPFCPIGSVNCIISCPFVSFHYATASGF